MSREKAKKAKARSKRDAYRLRRLGQAPAVAGGFPLQSST